MLLGEYFKSRPGGQALLAKAIGAHAPDVSRWAAGQRPVPVGRCTAIELATCGAVRRWDLRPADWHLIWPELLGVDGAPEPLQLQEHARAA